MCPPQKPAVFTSSIQTTDPTPDEPGQKRRPDAAHSQGATPEVAGLGQCSGMTPEIERGRPTNVLDGSAWELECADAPATVDVFGPGDPAS
jgi:hypothetical protein